MNPKGIIRKESQSIKKKDKLIDKGLSYFKKTVLIVDDEYNFRLLFRELVELISSDFEILDVEDGTKAIELIKNRNGKIDLISTDIVQPHISGLEFAKMVKQNYPHIKIIICSAHPSAIKNIDPADYFDHFICKPPKVEEYMRIVKKFLNI